MSMVSPCQQDCTIFAVGYINSLSDNAQNKQAEMKRRTPATDYKASLRLNWSETTDNSQPIISLPVQWEWQ